MSSEMFCERGIWWQGELSPTNVEFPYYTKNLLNLDLRASDDSDFLNRL